MKNIEIEARFKEIDVSNIVERARELGGLDMGEHLLEETIFYDKELLWRDRGQFARLRSYAGKNIFTYKHVKADRIDGTEEIEFEVDKPDQLKTFLERIGLTPFRVQQKKRWTLKFDGVTLDIDHWPMIPPYLEIEGESEEKIKETAEKLGLLWENALFIDARKIIEGYGIDVSTFKFFTFDKCE
jgi:adenylate cyclase class 2